MVEVEADDALGAAASVASADDRVERAIICTPDKDLARCVGGKVVQFDGRAGQFRDSAAVREKYGVDLSSTRLLSTRRSRQLTAQPSPTASSPIH